MKKSKKILLSFLIGAMLFLVFPNMVSAHSNSQFLNEGEKQEISNEIEKLLESRTAIMVSDKQVFCENQFTTKSANIEEERQQKQIAQFRDELREAGETYSSARTETTVINSEKISDSRISMTVKEETYLTIAETGVETGYGADHEFILEKNDNGWNIVEDKQLDPSGLLPLGIAEEYVEKTSQYFDNVEGEVLDPIDIKPASIQKNDKEIEEKNLNAKAGYSYTAMAKYLEKYWSKYNPAYRNFTKNGGDCTNFVSQALRAGGWKDKPGWYRNANYWWYNKSNQTWSWTAVDYWATFAKNSGRTSILNNVWSLRIGDVLQVRAKGSSQKNHTMMVSYVSNGTPYFTYHTSDRYRRSLNQVLKDWKGGTFYAYRT